MSILRHSGARAQRANAKSELQRNAQLWIPGPRFARPGMTSHGASSSRSRRRGGGSSVSWPLAARAQERVRRVGVLMTSRPTIRRRSSHGGVPAGTAGNWAGPSAATCGSIIRWATTDAVERLRKARGGTGRARARRHPGAWRRRRGGVAAGDPHRADRVRAIAIDPVGAGFVDEPGAAGRQRHRLHAVRIQPGREMAGAAQGDRAGRDASGRASGSHPRPPGSDSWPSSRPWRRRSRDGADPDRHARRRRDRARHRGIRARLRTAA